MSLRLCQTIAGRPNLKSRHKLDVLSVDGKGYVVYPSSSNVVLLTSELDLAHTLEFWRALPHRTASSSTQEVQGVRCNESRSLIIAWADVHVAIWQYLPAKHDKPGWTSHSTVVASAPVTCLDYHDDTLVLGTRNGIEYWRMDMKSGVVVWDKLWERSYPAPSTLTLSPTNSHVAWYQEGQRAVYVLGVNRKGNAVGIPQELRHPREISWIDWRKPSSLSGDAHLYTITTNSVFRIYSPVLDDPSWFQLLSSLDSKTFALTSTAQPRLEATSSAGAIWPLDASVLRQTIASDLASIREKTKAAAPELTKLLEALAVEESDVIAWIGQNGEMSLRSIVNMDRKPPTLLKSLPLARMSLPPALALERIGSSSRLLRQADQLLIVTPPAKDTGLLHSFRLDIIDILSSRATGISSASDISRQEDSLVIQLEQPIDRFIRTQNGRGLLSIGQGAEIGVWHKQRLGKVAKDSSAPKALLGRGYWHKPEMPLAAAIFSSGRAIVFYTKANDRPEIALQHLGEDGATPTKSISLPDFRLDGDDEVQMLLGFSDIDDGHSSRGRRTQRAVIVAASRKGIAWVWRLESRSLSRASEGSEQLQTSPTGFALESPSIKMSQYQLPIDQAEPHLVLPVDPMGWHQSVVDWKSDTPLQDMILTISQNGVAEFWSPELGHHFARELPHASHFTVNGHCEHGEKKPWYRSGVVRTGRKNALMARCSSRKKTALICEDSQSRCELSIWDSKVSEFSTGLELTHFFDSEEMIQDLDWTTTSDLQSVLAVGFTHRVVLICEQRMSYVESTPGWAPFITIDLERYTSMPISDSIWLAGGSLAVGAGNQVYLFSRFLDRDTPVPSPSASAKSVTIGTEGPEDIFQLIASQNGPLWDYHPTVLAQCLLWNKLDLVKNVLRKLLESLRRSEESGGKRLDNRRLDSSVFFSSTCAVKPARAVSRTYDGLFDATPVDADDDSEENGLTPKMVTDLINGLDGSIHIPLDHAEKSLLATIAQATLEVERQRRALDLCGLRYLISIRMYVNQDRRSGQSGTVTPASTSQQQFTNRLSFRNFVWAMHSESQEVLLGAATECCHNGKLSWSEAKTLGVFLWLKSSDSLKAQLEVVARNRFMADEERDPTSCSLIFFALGKKKVVHGLWRQAPGHREQPMMLKFLANNFELDRWKTAAIKNAYALLSKQRYEYAAAFFVLGGSPEDAINVVLRQLDDWQLAFALARVVEGSLYGPLVKSVLNDTVLPTAFEGGHRWLATWAFWSLGRRDLAVRVIISPMDEVCTAWTSEKATTVGVSENDDPSLLLLFQHLKSKSLQTAKGTSEIPEKMEFDFVLHNARVFFRMGCHALGLNLLRSWSFERPFFPPPKPRTRTPSPLPGTLVSFDSHRPRRPSVSSSGTESFLRPSPRRPSFRLSGHMRKESMVMDMDVLAEGASEPATRVGSPRTEGDKGDPVIQEEPIESSIESKIGPEPGEEKPRKMGNLMKELKQDVQQGGMEFNMDSFF